MSQRIQPLVSWFGGKARMAPIIAAKLPEHKIYVEPYGGAAGVLLAKPPSYIEVYNDLHDGIVTLFRVVRDPLLREQLLDLLELTPYSRSEWRDCNDTWQEETDPLEKARKVFVTLNQNFVGDLKNGSWSFGGPKSYNVAQNFYSSFKRIKTVAERFKNVQIECKPALEVLHRWDSPDTAVYLDPPYLHSTRKRTSNYLFEMSEKDHLDLLGWCLSAQSKVIISGYPSELYADTLLTAGWKTETYSAVASSAMSSNGNGLKGKPRDVTKRIEVLWFSPNCQIAPTLWDIPQYAEVKNA